jgi:cellobiose-specific phosphotransferase system component IIA
MMTQLTDTIPKLKNYFMFVGALFIGDLCHVIVVCYNKKELPLKKYTSAVFCLSHAHKNISHAHKNYQKSTFNSEIQESKFAMKLLQHCDDVMLTGAMTSCR